MSTKRQQVEGQISLFDYAKPDYKGAVDEITRLTIERDFELYLNAKKCPHCNNDPDSCFISCHDYFLKCPKCGIHTDTYKHTYEAIQAWNLDKITTWNGKHMKTQTAADDDYIREHPTCFYVFGHYLDRSKGWHKVPDELPNFTTWQVIDVVLYGKTTGTPWMEHETWEAKDWTFRSRDARRDTETIEVLAWKLSEEEKDGQIDS